MRLILAGEGKPSGHPGASADAPIAA